MDSSTDGCFGVTALKITHSTSLTQFVIMCFIFLYSGFLEMARDVSVPMTKVAWNFPGFFTSL